MSETESTTNKAFRTYPYGAKGRQLIDSASILMPGISKAEIVNYSLFHLIYCMNQEMKADPSLSVRQSMEKVLDPIKDITYEDILRTVTPTAKNQTPLDSFIGIRVVRIDRESGLPIEGDSEEGQKAFIDYIYDDGEASE